MVPLSITHRRLLSKYIPQITCKDISKYESLLALQNDMYIEFVLSFKLKKVRTPTNLIEEINKEAKNVFYPYNREFELLSKLWQARREFALTQGNFHQIPTNWRDLGNFIWKLLKYYAIEFYALPVLWKNKVKGFFSALFSFK
jgi:hypothetical protein